MLFAFILGLANNACDNGSGVLLMHEGNHISYLSKGLSVRHQSLSIYDKELLALAMIVTKWT